jgi:hypothetical protein
MQPRFARLGQKYLPFACGLGDPRLGHFFGDAGTERVVECFLGGLQHRSDSMTLGREECCAVRDGGYDSVPLSTSRPIKRPHVF